MTRRRREGSFVMFVRSTWRERRDQLGPHLRGTLVDLLVECNHRTGELRGSIRDLSDLLGTRPETLREHLVALESFGEVEWTRAANRHGVSVIRVLHYGELTDSETESLDRSSDRLPTGYRPAADSET